MSRPPRAWTATLLASLALLVVPTLLTVPPAADAATGTGLTVRVSGVPARQAANLQVRFPDGTTRALQRTTRFAGAPVGRYVISADAVTVGSGPGAGRYSLVATARAASVSAGAHTVVRARFARTALVVGATAVPAGARAVVQVVGPNGFRRTYSGARTTTFRNVPVGRYLISADPIVVPKATGTAAAGTYYPTVPAAVDVADGGTATLRADFTDLVAPGVVVADEAAVAATSIDPGSRPGTAGTVRLRGDFAPGDLLAAGVTTATPQGLLVRLGARRGSSGDSITFAATTVPLTTVVPRGSFAQTVSGAATLDGRSPGSLTAAIATKTPGSFTMTNPFRMTIPCSSRAAMGVEAKVRTLIQAAVSARWDAALPATTSVTVDATARAVARMNVWVTGASACSGTKSRLGSAVPLGTVVTTVGPVPIVLVQTVSFVAEGQAGTQAAMSTSLKSDVTTSTVLTATTRGSSSSQQEPQVASTAGQPWATGSGAATIMIGAKLRTKLYGIDGAYASIKVGPNLTVDRSSTPWWQVAGRATAGIGVRLAAFGIRQGKADLLTRTWPVSDAGAPMPR